MTCAKKRTHGIMVLKSGMSPGINGVSDMPVLSFEGRKVRMTDAQATTVATLAGTAKGGFACIHGYKPSTNVVEQPIFDVTLISRISYDRLCERKLKALDSLTFEQAKPVLAQFPKLASMSESEQRKLFQTRLAFMTGQVEKDRDRSSAQHEAHRRNYVTIAQGVIGHLVTETVEEDGKRLKLPVVDSNGVYTLDHIMVAGLPVQKRVIAEGSYKTVNSRAPTIMGHAIERLLPRVSTQYRRYSLKGDNFDSVSISQAQIEPDPELEGLLTG